MTPAGVATASRHGPHGGRHRIGAGAISASPVPHPLAYPGLLLFTLVLYLRPSDYFPIGEFGIAKIVGAGTLVVFLIERFASRQSLSVLPTGLKYLLGLVGMMFLSVPFAVDPREAINTIFGLFLKVVLVFVLLINVVSSYDRLRRLMSLTVLCGTVIAVGTLLNFAAGKNLVGGYRATGAFGGTTLGGMFENPNDLALALDMLLPLALGLALTARSHRTKLLYMASGAAMVGSVYVTYSRGGLAALLAVGAYLLVTMGRRYPVLTIALVFAGLVLAMGYGVRALSILDPSLDVSGSSSARLALLLRSLAVFTANPKVWVVGLGVGNFHIVSLHELVNHNSYLQVLTEVGAPAFVLYVLFLRSAFVGLKDVVRSGSPSHGPSTVAVTGVAIRASLVAYAVGSLFLSVAYQWYVYYAAGYAVWLGQVARVSRATNTSRRGRERGAA